MLYYLKHAEILRWSVELPKITFKAQYLANTTGVLQVTHLVCVYGGGSLIFTLRRRLLAHNSWPSALYESDERIE